MTRRDNLRLTLAGKIPRWVPFALNFAQWYEHHRRFESLPAELRGCGDYVDAMKALGCDIFSRNLDGGFRTGDAKLVQKVTTIPADTGPRTIVEYETPYGTLRGITQFQTRLTTSHTEEYLVKDWSADGDAFRCYLDQRVASWDEEAFDTVDRKIGDDGLVNVPVACTPLKFLHLTFGLEYTCLFAMDHPEAAEQICRTYWGQVWPVLEQLARHRRVESICLMDNVDTPFYSPALAGEFWAPYVRQTTELFASRRKTVFVHACGKLAGLNEVFATCGVSGLEGIAHAPLGDWSAVEAQRCHDRFIFIGGFSAHEQELPSDDEVRAFYREYLPRARKDRFIFSSSCQTSIATPWERIKLVRDICREWGGYPAETTEPKGAAT